MTNYFLGGEDKIVWLQPKDNYEYLRESWYWDLDPDGFHMNHATPALCGDGGQLSHIVAYATMKSFVPSNNDGFIARRFWFVKGYDQFEGCLTSMPPNRNYEWDWCVQVGSVIANKQSLLYKQPTVTAQPKRKKR